MKNNQRLLIIILIIISITHIYQACERCYLIQKKEHIVQLDDYYQFGHVVEAQGSIYIAGGYIYGSTGWEPHDPLKINYGSGSLVPWDTTFVDKKFGSQVGTFDNEIYVCGGEDNLGAVSQVCFIYDTESNQWSLRQQNLGTAYGAEVMKEEIMYIVGGNAQPLLSLTPGVENSVNEPTITGVIDQQRTNAKSVLYNDIIYTYGGEMNQMALNRLTAFNLTTQENMLITTNNNTFLNRTRFASARIGQYWYMTGGDHRLTEDPLYRLDLESMNWKIMEETPFFQYTRFDMVAINNQLYTFNIINNITRMDRVLLNETTCYSDYTDSSCQTLSICETCKNTTTQFCASGYCHCEEGYASFTCSKKNATCGTTLNMTHIASGNMVTHFGNGVVYKDELYFMGGILDGVPIGLNRYNLLDSSIEAIKGENSPIPAFAEGRTCVNRDEHIYCFGGKNNIGHLNEFFSLNLINLMVNLVTLQTPLANADSVLIGNNMVVFGGSRMIPYFSTTYKIDLFSPNLTIIGHMKDLRAYHTAEYDPDTSKVYIFGGRNDSSTFLGTFETFDTKTYESTRVLLEGNQPSARMSHISVIMNRHMFIFGGQHVTLLSDIWKFHLTNYTWTQISFPQLSSSSFIQGSAFIYNESIILYAKDRIYQIKEIESCACAPGYTGDTCEEPICFNELQNSSNVCHGNGECVGPDTCNCQQYTMSVCPQGSPCLHNCQLDLRHNLTVSTPAYCEPLNISFYFLEQSDMIQNAKVAVSSSLFNVNLTRHPTVPIYYTILSSFEGRANSIFPMSINITGIPMMETPNLQWLNHYHIRSPSCDMIVTLQKDFIENEIVEFDLSEHRRCFTLLPIENTTFINDQLRVLTPKKEETLFINTLQGCTILQITYRVLPLTIQANIQGGSQVIQSNTTYSLNWEGSILKLMNSSRNFIPQFLWQCVALTASPCPDLLHNVSSQNVIFAKGQYNITFTLKVKGIPTNSSQTIHLNVIQNDINDLHLSLLHSNFVYPKEPFTVTVSTQFKSDKFEYIWFYRYSVMDTFTYAKTTDIPLADFQFDRSFVDLKCQVKDLVAGHEGITSLNLFMQQAPIINNIFLSHAIVPLNTKLNVQFLVLSTQLSLEYAVDYLVAGIYMPLYVSPTPSFSIFLPKTGNVTLKLSVRDERGGSAFQIKTIQSTPPTNTLNFTSGIASLNTIEEKTQYSFMYLNQNNVTDDEVNATLAIFDSFATTTDRAYVQSSMLHNILPKLNFSNPKIKTKTLQTISQSLNLFNSTKVYTHNKQLSTNYFKVISKSMDTNVTMDQPASNEEKENLKTAHASVTQLTKMLDNNLYLGEAYDLETPSMNISITKLNPSSISIKSSSVQVGSSFRASLLSQIASQHVAVDAFKGLSMIHNRFNYVVNSNQNETKMNFHQMIDLTFTNSQEKILLANLSQPIQLEFSKTIYELPLNVSEDSAYYVPSCKYFNETTMTWQRNGVYYQDGSCYAEHTTEFAIDFDLILPKFNLIDFEKHSITKLNTDNMTVTLILAGILFGYAVLMCLFQVLDIVTACISRLNIPKQPNLPIGYLDATGHHHFVIPIFQRLRDIHQWVSVILSPNSPDRSYSKQQRLTVLLVLILGIMMSNALTVGIGADNESIYVTACIVADLITQPFTLLAAFLFLKVKPSEQKNKSSRKKIVKSFSKLASTHESVELKELNHKLQLIEENPDSPIVSGIWKSFVAPLAFKAIHLVTRLKNKDLFLFGSLGNHSLVIFVYRHATNEWEKKPCQDAVLPEQHMDGGQYVYVESKNCIYYIYPSHTTKRLNTLIFDLRIGQWKPKIVENGNHHFLKVGLVVHKENIYCFGGQSGNFKKLNEFSYFDTITEQWHSIGLSRVSLNPSPRSSPLLFTLDNTLYIVGGVDDAQQTIHDCYTFNEELSSFSLVSENVHLPDDVSLAHVLEKNPDDMVLGCYRSHASLNSIHWTLLDSKQHIQFSPTMQTTVDMTTQTQMFPGCLSYSANSNSIYMLDNLQYHEFDSTASSEDREKLLEKVEIEQFVTRTQTKRFIRDFGILFLDGVLLKLSLFFKSIDIKKIGIFIILLSTLVYFLVLAVGCYIMVYINWLGVIGTTTYGVMGLLSYMTLMIELYIQSKRKIYLENSIKYRTRLTFVFSILLFLSAIISFFVGIGVVYGLSHIQSETDRVGVMLVISIFFIGLIINLLRFGIYLLWAPSRQKSKLASLFERPWFPHFFKYPIYLICWAEIGVMCWILVMYSIKFHEENMTPDWLLACFLGNTQNFLLDQTLVFITTTFVMVAVLQFFEALIRPRKAVMVVLDEHHVDEDFLSIKSSTIPVEESFRPVFMSS